MTTKRLVAVFLTALTLCITLVLGGCRKEDGKISENNDTATTKPHTTNTPMESIESKVPDAIDKIIP